MVLRLDRKWKKEKYTIGNLYVNGAFFCNTLEDTDRGLLQEHPLSYIKKTKVYGETAIPRGRYIVDMHTKSPKFANRAWAIPFKGELPRLKGVPGFDGVLIHVGNKASDSLGCILVGKNTAKGQVLESAATFKALMRQYLIPASIKNEIIYITIE